uniref:RBR-type E3 ubiquitin transferase n=1 Tax=Solanum tuberosum TaxID=4113 RepID=A0A075BQK8_SOLTU|nr:ring finger like protein [Solanum tuberosum]AGO14654.1 ring finger like protein [Solanum tuberosum]
MAPRNLISDAKLAKELQKQYVIGDSLEIFARYEKGLIESAIPNREKLYCPYKKCAKLLSHDPTDEEAEIIIKGKCPWCAGLLCARCRVPWHTGRDCQQFQREEKDREDDLRVKLLAENCKWKNCPHCNSLVDKVDDGGVHIACRCKEEFCYGCGETWSERHWNCQTR